jgi:hypothetical protein
MLNERPMLQAVPVPLVLPVDCGANHALPLKLLLL